MHLTLDTIGDVIFQKRETLKNLKEEREDLINKLCGNQRNINDFTSKIGQLEVEHKKLSEITYGQKNQVGCDATTLSPDSRTLGKTQEVRRD
jgi:predicted nuclease with TOPRIM domain